MSSYINISRFFQVTKYTYIHTHKYKSELEFIYGIPEIGERIVDFSLFIYSIFGFSRKIKELLKNDSA
jgi:hypothetical protein